MSAPLSRRMDWPERLAIAALFAAAVALFVYGGVISAIAFTLCGFMGWTRMVEHVQAQGKSTLSGKGRGVVAAVLAIVGVLAMPSGAANSPADHAASEGGDERNVADNGAAAVEANQTKVTLAEGQAMERRNDAKIKSLLADLKTLHERDYETRLTFWNDIVALAPANPEYADKRQELADQVAGLDVLRDHPEQGMVVEKVRGRKEGFGNVLIIDITLRNDALSNLKDFQITCESKGHSGTVIDSNTRMLYEVVDARSTRTFRKVNMGLLHSQAASTHCTVDQAAIS